MEIFVLTSVRFAKRAEGEWSNHTSQNKNLQAIIYTRFPCCAQACKWDLHSASM